MKSQTIVDPNEFNRVGRYLESMDESYAPYDGHIDWRVPASIVSLLGKYLPSGEEVDDEIRYLNRYKG